MSLAWLLPVFAVMSFLLTGLVRRYALLRNLLDVPNSRSSHVLPTPRGGGVAIVAVYILALLFFYVQGLVAYEEFMALFCVGILSAIIGFADDHGHVQAGWRLLVHFLIGAWGVYWVGGLAPLEVLDTSIGLGWVGIFFAVIYLVWMLNLYNFMDGIDSLASVQAVSVCVSAAFISYLATSQVHWPSLLLAACVLGFLIWNLPPAKIFMGDAGSGFLGAVIGVLTLQAGWQSSNLQWGWLILMGVFVVDATYTLLRRLVRGDKVYQAHSSHAYQQAARSFSGHFPVSVCVLLINLFWLLPVSVAVVFEVVDGFLALVISYIPLCFLAVRFRAGELMLKKSSVRP